MKKLVILMIVICVLLVTLVAGAQENDVVYELVSQKHSLINHEVVLKVTNLDKTDWKKFQFNVSGVDKWFDVQEPTVEILRRRWFDEPVYVDLEVEIECADTILNETEGRVCYKYDRNYSHYVTKSEEYWLNVGVNKVKVNNYKEYIKLDNEYYLWQEEEYYFRIRWEVPLAEYHRGSIGNWEINPDDWWNASWNYCRNVTINNNVPSTLTNFPVLINITNTENMSSDLRDVRFTSAVCDDGGSELDYEIDFIEGDSALVWVRIPSFTSGDNVIGMYYNNSGADVGENPTGVWDNDFLFVYHMNDNSTSSVNDSTANANHGKKTSANNPIQHGSGTAGFIGNSQYFDGGDDIRTQTNIASLDGAVPVTLEVWANTTTLADFTILVGIGPSNGYFRMGYYSSAWYLFASGGDWNTGDSTAITSATYMGLTYDGSTSRWVLNNKLLGTETDTKDKGDGGVYIGFDGGSWYWTGNIDEARVSNVSRSPDWKNMTYQIVASQSSLVTINTQTEGTSPPIDNRPITQTPVIIPDPAYSNSNLNCSAVATDDLNTSLTMEFTWLLNGAHENTYDFNISATNNTQQYTGDMVTEQLFVGDNWTCRAKTSDDTGFGTQNTTVIQISNTLPTWTESASDQVYIHYINNVSYDLNASDIDPSQSLVYYINDSNFDINSASGVINKTIIGDDYGNYSIRVNASDGFGWINQSFNIEIVNMSVGNYSPTIGNVEILPTSPQSNDSVLLGYCQADDINGDNVSYSWKWFLNNLIVEETDFSYYCYQEFANESDECGNGAGLYELSEPSKWSSGLRTYDGDWDTWGQNHDGTGTPLFINYSIPDGALSTSSWQVRYGNLTPLNRVNLSLPSECFSSDTLQLRFISRNFAGRPGNYSCHNGTGWEILLTRNEARLYEEAMWWNISNTYVEGNNINLENYSIDTANIGDVFVLECTAFDGLNYSNATNSSSVTVLNTPPTLSADLFGDDFLWLFPTGNYYYNRTRANFTCSYNCSDYDGDNCDAYLSYKWFVNGTPYSYDNVRVFNSTFTSKGTTVGCEVTVNDNRSSDNVSISNTSVVTVLNTVPIVGEVALSYPIYENETAFCYANATDNDGDSLTYNYKWFVDDVIVTNEVNSNLSNDNFTYNQQIVCEVMAEDDEVNSTRLNTSVVTVEKYNNMRLWFSETVSGYIVSDIYVGYFSTNFLNVSLRTLGDGYVDVFYNNDTDNNYQQVYTFYNENNTEVSEYLIVEIPDLVQQVKVMSGSSTLSDARVCAYASGNHSGVGTLGWYVVFCDYTNSQGIAQLSVNDQDEYKICAYKDDYVDECELHYITPSNTDLIYLNMDSSGTSDSVVITYSTCPSVVRINTTCVFGANSSSLWASICINYTSPVTIGSSCRFNYYEHEFNVSVNVTQTPVNVSIYLNGLLEGGYQVEYDIGNVTVDVRWSQALIDTIEDEPEYLTLFYFIVLILGVIFGFVMDNYFKGMGIYVTAMWFGIIGSSGFYLLWIPTILVGIYAIVEQIRPYMKTER